MGVFTMPSLGADMEAGTLAEWLVAPGDAVTRGQVVAVVETQKGAIEIEIFEDGVVERLEADLGATLPVGSPLAVIRAAGEAKAEAGAKAAAPSAAEVEKPAKAPAPSKPPAEAKPEPKPEPTPEPKPERAPPAAKPPPARTGAPTPAPRPAPSGAPASSPAARVLATERGVDLAALKGSGPGGAILLADVEAASDGARPAAPAKAGASPSEAPARKPGLDMAAMRVAIANAMARSKREIPHYYLSLPIDLQAATDWLAETNAGREPDQRLLMGALIVKATALAAAGVAEMNGHYGENGFAPSQAVHAGVAIALRGGGLIAPAIHDADTLTLDEVMAAMRDLVARARTGRLRSSEMTDGTITISAMGEAGADTLTGVIYPPQVALVGIGAPALRPWVVDGKVTPRQVVTVTLSADHRVSDGRRGAKFLGAIDTALQKPEAL